MFAHANWISARSIIEGLIVLPLLVIISTYYSVTQTLIMGGGKYYKFFDINFIYHSTFFSSSLHTKGSFIII